MSYINKRNESKKSADLLFSEGYYNSAANRYYYCIYQSILEYNRCNNINITTQELKKHNNHKITLEKFTEHFIMQNSLPEQEIRRIRNDLEMAKKIRNKADYKYEGIKRREAVEIREIIDYFISLGVIYL